MIPRIAHFVFGLGEQREPFHFLHYVSIESCRRVLAPERIYFHHKQLPWGPWWERTAPHVTPVEVDHVPAVLAADYVPSRVPERYRYAHHADFRRLEALIEYGGLYADIDTIFLRPFPLELFRAPFVIGREIEVRDELTGELRPSLCNALLLSEPRAEFAVEWRARMADALNGTWSNHSGFLPERLSRLMPTTVRIEPEASFFSFQPTAAGLSKLLERRAEVPAEALSIHLWAHLWWERTRRDFSQAHAGWYTPPLIQGIPTTLAEIVRPYLPEPVAASRRGVRAPRTAPRRWRYLFLDEHSGYGVAAQRCIDALVESGAELEALPFIPGEGHGFAYQPARPLASAASDEAVVAHLVPEFLGFVRGRLPEAFLVSHTIWDTDRLPEHWVACLNQADLVVTPSRFSAEAMSGSPVTTPIEVVPHVAPQLSDQPSLNWPPVADGTFVFYAIAEWTERKALELTVEAYLRAFGARDRVLLVIKTSAADRRRRRAAPGSAVEGTAAWALARLLAGHQDPPAVSLITRDLTNAEIEALHRRGDCFVSLTRSEGFGLGSFDAAAHGNPVVITGFGGQLDYLAGSPYLVRFDLVPVEDPMGYPSFAPDQRWAQPDIDHAASLMRAVAQKPDEARQACGPLAAEIRDRFRPQAVAAAFRGAVERHIRRERKRPPPTGWELRL